MYMAFTSHAVVAAASATPTLPSSRQLAKHKHLKTP